MSHEKTPVIQVIVEIPIAAIPAVANIPRHVEAQLTHKQGVALGSVTQALDRLGARLEGGRRVVSFADALRYVLEQIAEAAAENHPGIEQRFGPGDGGESS